MKKSIRVCVTFAACLIVFGALTGCSKKEEEAPVAPSQSADGQKPIATPLNNQPGNQPMRATQ